MQTKETKEPTRPATIQQHVERAVRLITQFFVLVGALSWGAYGFYNTNVVENILGQGAAASAFYLATSLSAIYIILLKVLLKG